MAFISLNPATGEKVKAFDTMTDDQVEAALSLSLSAHKTLKSWPMEDRRAAMHRIADILEQEAEDLGAIITLEMGKTLKSAIAEVKKCALGCRYYADHAEAMMADEEVNLGGAAKTYKTYLPLGPIVAVMPWNYPLWQVYRFVAPALMAGNTGILKHASNVPQCGLSVEDVVRRAGFPNGALINVFASIDQIGTMLRDDRVKGATLTGSERAGSSVGAICGEVIKPTVLELGGSDAFIVMPSADIDKAVSTAITARTQNCGQSCIAGKRFIIHADIYEEFREKFKTAFEALRIGDPHDPSTDIGPLVTQSSRAEITQQRCWVGVSALDPHVTNLKRPST